MVQGAMNMVYIIGRQFVSMYRRLEATSPSVAHVSEFGQ